jgi:hypothetical protein
MGPLPGITCQPACDSKTGQKAARVHLLHDKRDGPDPETEHKEIRAMLRCMRDFSTDREPEGGEILRFRPDFTLSGHALSTPNP